MNTSQKVEICWCRKCRLAHFINYLQIFNQNLIWSWMIYIAYFLRSRNQWVCSSIKCALVLCAVLTNAISKAIIVSYKLALRHISMRRSHLLSKRSNSKSSNLHMLAKVFRVNSRFWFTFFDSRRFLTQLQSADAVKNISSSICLAVDSHRSSRELRAMRYSWESLSWRILIWRSHKSCLFFESLISDSSTLRESLLWESSRSCYFVFYLNSLHDHSFERTSDCYSWKSLACFIVLFASHSINRLFRLTLKKSLIWES